MAAPEPGSDWHTATVSQFAQLFNQSVAQYDVIATDNPNLQPFKARGAKLILWHGWADQLIFRRGTIQYYERVQEKTKGHAARFAWLFMAPGVAHCVGGSGPAPADPFGALVNWVENKVEPDELLAVRRDARGNVVQSRPLCRFPAQAHYDGLGRTNDAANFECR